jgi:hypothetical protein
VLAISGGQVMANVLEILPDIEERADVKIVARRSFMRNCASKIPPRPMRFSRTVSAATW